MEGKWSNGLTKVTLLLSESRCDSRTFQVQTVLRGTEGRGLWSWGWRHFCGLTLTGSGILALEWEREVEESTEAESLAVLAVHTAKTWGCHPPLRLWGGCAPCQIPKSLCPSKDRHGRAPFMPSNEGTPTSSSSLHKDRPPVGRWLIYYFGASFPLNLFFSLYFMSLLVCITAMLRA